MKKQLKGKKLAKGEYAAEMWKLQQDNQKLGKKPRQTKWWHLPTVAIPLLQSIPALNKKIDEARINDLEKRVEHKKKLARAHMDAGRFGKANKMANCAKANEREIRKMGR